MPIPTATQTPTDVLSPLLSAAGVVENGNGLYTLFDSVVGENDVLFSPWGALTDEGVVGLPKTNVNRFLSERQILHL
jgi:hypothetical protein